MHCRIEINFVNDMIVIKHCDCLSFLSLTILQVYWQDGYPSGSQWLCNINNDFCLISACRLRFGRLFFGINLLTYVGYLVCLTSFLLVTYPGKLDRQTGCSFYLADEDDSLADSHTRQVRCFLFLSLFIFPFPLCLSAAGCLCICQTTVWSGMSGC